MKTKAIRPIVKAAFRCNELVYQFQTIDVEDGLLSTGSVEEVNATYNDAHLIGEAKNRLDMSRCNIVDGGFDPDGEDYKIHQREFKQLSNFLNRWSAQS